MVIQGEVCWLWWCGGGEVGSVVLQAEVWWREVHGWPLQVQSETQRLPCRVAESRHTLIFSCSLLTILGSRALSLSGLTEARMHNLLANNISERAKALVRVLHR